MLGFPDVACCIADRCRRVPVGSLLPRKHISKPDERREGKGREDTMCIFTHVENYQHYIVTITIDIGNLTVDPAGTFGCIYQ